MTALNPLMTVGGQLSEMWIVHRGLSKREALARALAALEEAQLPDPAGALNAFRHEPSAGSASG